MSIQATPKNLTPAQVTRQRRKTTFTNFCQQFMHSKGGMIGLIFLLLVALVALLAPVIAPAKLLDVTQIENPVKFAVPSAEHLFGTDHLGREIWVRMVWGARISLLVGLIATALSMIIGTLVGIAADHFRGWVSGLLMRIIDFFFVLPSLILAIALSSVMSRGVWTIIIAIAITSWAGTARVVRSQTLTVASRDYVERARTLGASDWHIIIKHLLPGVLPLVLANTTLTVGSAIIAESTLAFLGLGDTTQQSWGTVLRNALDVSAASTGYWWYVLVPGVAIVLVVLAFTLIGRAVENIVNPTLRSR